MNKLLSAYSPKVGIKGKFIISRQNHGFHTRTYPCDGSPDSSAAAAGSDRRAGKHLNTGSYRAVINMQKVKNEIHMLINKFV